VPGVDLDHLLRLLRDPGIESLAIAQLAGVPREEAGRATRLLAGLASAKPEEVATLPGALAAALCRAAAEAGRADVLAALAGHASRDVAKEAKRGLHLMKVRGAAVPELPRPPPPAARPPPPEAPPQAYASAPDGRGERAVWMGRAVAGKGIELAQAVISDEKGLVELQVAMLGRKEYRTFTAGLVERGASMAVVEIPAAQAHALVAQARAATERAGGKAPEGADLWLSRLGPAEAPPDPAEGFAPLPAEEEREALAASAKLHDLALLRGWLADEAHLRGVAAKLDEVAVSSLYVDERQRAEQAKRIIADATESWLDPARRAQLARRLQVVARHLDQIGEPAHARAAAAAARALASGTPAGAIPFARLLVEKAFPSAGGPSDAGQGAERIDRPGLVR